MTIRESLQALSHTSKKGGGTLEVESGRAVAAPLGSALLIKTSVLKDVLSSESH